MPFGQVGLLETLIGFLRAPRLEVIAFIESLCRYGSSSGPAGQQEHGLKVYPDSSVLFGCVPVAIFNGYGLEVDKEGCKIFDRFRFMCSAIGLPTS